MDLADLKIGDLVRNTRNWTVGLWRVTSIDYAGEKAHVREHPAVPEGKGGMSGWMPVADLAWSEQS